MYKSLSWQKGCDSVNLDKVVSNHREGEDPQGTLFGGEDSPEDDAMRIVDIGG